MRRALALAVVVLAGCGQSPPEAVRDSLRDYYEALLDERHDDACDRMTLATRRVVVKNARELQPDVPVNRMVTACEDAMPLLIKGGPGTISDGGRAWREALDRLPRARVSLTGNRAAVYDDPQDGFPTRLIDDDGEWRIAREDEARSWPE